MKKSDFKVVLDIREKMFEEKKRGTLSFRAESDRAAGLAIGFLPSRKGRDAKLVIMPVDWSKWNRYDNALRKEIGWHDLNGYWYSGETWEVSSANGNEISVKRAKLKKLPTLLRNELYVYQLVSDFFEKAPPAGYFDGECYDMQDCLEEHIGDKISELDLFDDGDDNG